MLLKDPLRFGVLVQDLADVHFLIELLLSPPHTLRSSLNLISPNLIKNFGRSHVFGNNPVLLNNTLTFWSTKKMI
ncbi:MAG: hypothetical protein A2Z51_02610 [Deltaproteobacteria bacterium RBG_19FT_COMBO_52_11]|nr:MAG: hypothetical protein A2Z51_02610 [Deltaproteobacteria bacterium RBG_19FT_COMBO_52_11]